MFSLEVKRNRTGLRVLVCLNQHLVTFLRLHYHPPPTLHCTEFKWSQAIVKEKEQPCKSSASLDPRISYLTLPSCIIQWSLDLADSIQQSIFFFFYLYIYTDRHPLLPIRPWCLIKPNVSPCPLAALTVPYISAALLSATGFGFTARMMMSPCSDAAERTPVFRDPTLCSTYFDMSR